MLSSDYGLRTLQFRSSATTDKTSSRRNGAVYPPDEARSVLATDAIMDAPMRLKFIMEKLMEK